MLEQQKQEQQKADKMRNETVQAAKLQVLKRKNLQKEQELEQQRHKNELKIIEEQQKLETAKDKNKTTEKAIFERQLTDQNQPVQHAEHADPQSARGEPQQAGDIREAGPIQYAVGHEAPVPHVGEDANPPYKRHDPSGALQKTPEKKIKRGAPFAPQKTHISAQRRGSYNPESPGRKLASVVSRFLSPPVLIVPYAATPGDGSVSPPQRTARADVSVLRPKKQPKMNLLNALAEIESDSGTEQQLRERRKIEDAKMKKRRDDYEAERRSARKRANQETDDEQAMALPPMAPIDVFKTPARNDFEKRVSRSFGGIETERERAADARKDLTPQKQWQQRVRSMDIEALERLFQQLPREAQIEYINPRDELTAEERRFLRQQEEDERYESEANESTRSRDSKKVNNDSYQTHAELLWSLEAKKRIPVFTGEREDNLKNFLMLFDEWSSDMQWSDQALLKELRSLLQGAALAQVKSSSANTYKDVRKLLERRFGKILSKDSALSALLSAKQGETESVKNYLKRFDKCRYEVEQNGGKLPQPEVLASVFKLSFKNELRVEMSRISTGKEKTTAQIETVVKKAERILKLANKTASSGDDEPPAPIFYTKGKSGQNSSQSSTKEFQLLWNKLSCLEDNLGRNSNSDSQGESSNESSRQYSTGRGGNYNKKAPLRQQKISQRV